MDGTIKTLVNHFYAFYAETFRFYSAAQNLFIVIY